RTAPPCCPAAAGGERRARSSTPRAPFRASSALPDIPPRRDRVRPAMRDAHIGEILVQPDDLRSRVRELGGQITRDYEGRDLLLVGVLKGAVFFLSDLMRHIEI